MLELSLFVACALVVGCVFWRRIGTFLSPPVLACFSLAGASVLALVLDNQVRAGADLHAGFTADPGPVALIYTVGLSSFILPWLGQRNLIGTPPPVEPNIWRTVLQLTLLTVFTLVITWGLLGQIPILSMLTGAQSIEDHLARIKELPLGLMMTNLMMATVLSLYVASAASLEELSAEEWMVLCLVAAALGVAALWQGNRQLILIILFFVFTRYFMRSQYDPEFVTPRKVVRRGVVLSLCVFGFLAAFTIINVIRLSALGRSSGPLELALYYSWPVYNMASIHAHIGYWGTGEPFYLLTELLPARLGGKDLWADLAPYLFEPTSPSGFFSYWYLSYGLPGVAAGGFMFGAASRWVFRRCLLSENWMQVYVLIAWTCATISVYSHVMTAAYFIFPLLLLLLVQGASRVEVRRRPATSPSQNGHTK
jgi:oligosaccharide repeat unit polymerase